MSLRRTEGTAGSFFSLGSQFLISGGSNRPTFVFSTEKIEPLSYLKDVLAFSVCYGHYPHVLSIFVISDLYVTCHLKKLSGFGVCVCEGGGSNPS